MKQNPVIYICVLIFSAAFLFFGNRLVSEEIVQEGYADPLIYFQGVVTDIVERLEEDFAHDWGRGDVDIFITFEARITTRGERRGDIVTARQHITPFIVLNEREVSEGDRVLIFYDDIMNRHHFAGFIRINYIIALGAVFFALVLLFARQKGFNAILALVLTCLAVFLVFIPAILAGRNIYATTLIICVYAIATTLLLVIGTNRKAFSAMLGCLGGVLTAGLLMVLMSSVINLIGDVDSDTRGLLFLPMDSPIDLPAIIFAGVILGAVGAIMDVAMSIASSLWELKESGGVSDFKSIFKSGITIGQDILGTMLNTLVLAYIGTSISLILLITANAASFTALFNAEMIVVEFLRALIGSFGMLSAIPLTAAICGKFYESP